MNSRIQKMQTRFPDGVDGMLITSAPNRRYFTGMRSSAGTLLITKDECFFIIDFRYIELARKTVKTAQVILQDKLYEQIGAIADERGMKTLAIETSSMTVGERNALAKKLPQLTILDTDEMDQAICELRAVKDPEELELIRKAQSITDAAFEHMLTFIKPGVTEREIAIELEHRMLLLGADKPAFDSIVVSGINSSLPHGVPSDKKVEMGEFITMDFGAMYGGYCSDMTRTVVLGYCTDEMEKVYNLVLEAQLAAIEKAAVGLKGCEVDAAARDLIYAAGYTGCFGHGTGHSLGLEIHESPRFSITCEDTCREGMILTVEPGIYLEGKFGCRIEDMIYFDGDKVENLTNSPKNLIVLCKS